MTYHANANPSLQPLPPSAVRPSGAFRAGSGDRVGGWLAGAVESFPVFDPQSRVARHHREAMLRVSWFAPAASSSTAGRDEERLRPQQQRLDRALVGGTR